MAPPLGFPLPRRAYIPEPGISLESVGPGPRAALTPSSRPRDKRPRVTLLDVLARHLASRRDQSFILHAGSRVTYGEFDRLTNRAAHVLRGLGVEAGDRVTLALGNSIQWVAAAFGALKIGAIVHPVNPALGARELRFIVGHADPRVIVTDAGGAGAVRAVRDAVPAARIAAFGEVDDALALDPLLERADESAPGDIPGGRQPALLLYTSGTTGNPKGGLTPHRGTGPTGPHLIRPPRPT